MQRTKLHTRMLLLDTAREAFFKKGFKAVSMREISQKSGVGLSNIYNYYPNKDSLLADVLMPLLEEFERLLRDHNGPDHLTVEIFTSAPLLQRWTERTVSMVLHYRKELKLLLFDSNGSKFEDFVKTWTERGANITGKEYMEVMKVRYPQLHTEISPFFINFASALWMNMLKEAVRHDHLSEEEIRCFIGEFVSFSTGGWGRLMQVTGAV